jgi:predicted nuclease of restriction endonuclease-like (RecB) superfamily
MKNMNITKTVDYAEFLKDIKYQIKAAQSAALRLVNKELIILYWNIGKSIVEKQKKEQWGDAIIEGLAKDLQNEFPGMKGFSARNLWRMRDLYVSYSVNEKLPPLVAEISWTNNLIILEKCPDHLQREFYIRMARKHSWSKLALLNHIENQTYEKTMLGQSNFETALPTELQSKAKIVLKDEYTFDFLELGTEYSERQLENAIMLKIERFLHEMGSIFAFVGRQYRIEISDKEYFIDILLYHRNLKCLVAIELKIDEFIPEYVGKMQFYLTALDTKVKMADENPSIGIILCKTKDKTTVEYALHDSKKPIGVASYTVVKTLPKELKEQLPNLEQIQKLIDSID